MKILVIQQKMIGDVLTSSILFEALRSKYPDAELHYLVEQQTEPVVANNPHIDKLLLLDPKKHRSFPALVSYGRKIRSEQYEVVIDVYAKISSAILTGLSGAGKKISYHKWYTSLAYTHTLGLKKTPETEAGLAIENRMLLLRPISSGFPPQLKPKIYLSKQEKDFARDLLRKSGVSQANPLLMISILGSSPAKTYPLEYMAEILDRIVAYANPQLLFNYIPNQQEQAQQLFDMCAPATRKKVFFQVFGRSLREFMAITSCCDALVGNEGGAVNIAKALGIPTFSVFSPQIKKENWSLYEDGSQNVSVHLKDHQPALFENRSRKELTKKAPHFYELLHPNLIFVPLKGFLERNLREL